MGAGPVDSLAFSWYGYDTYVQYRSTIDSLCNIFIDCDMTTPALPSDLPPDPPADGGLTLKMLRTRVAQLQGTAVESGQEQEMVPSGNQRGGGSISKQASPCMLVSC